MVSRRMIGIVDCGTGNMWSVQTAFEYLGATVRLVDDPRLLTECSHIVLPGVGSFRLAMKALIERGMADAIRREAENGKQMMGICLGMQLMARNSTEDCASGETTEGLGLIDAVVRKFDTTSNAALKIPHVGFNTVVVEESCGLFESFGRTADFYFTHSYRLIPDGVNCNSAICEHGEIFLAAFDAGNVCGTQFHPEKSQSNGLLIMKNFLDKAEC